MDEKKCATCAAATGCGWCDFGAAGSCMETATLDIACTAPTGSPTANGGTCPDKCANNTVVANKCKVDAGWKAQFPASCDPVNNPPTAGPTTAFTGTTGTTAAPTACALAYTKDGADCYQAISDFSCSYGCQKCTDGGSPGKLCKSVCDALKAKCPTVVADCGALSPFSDALCAADETDCAMDKIMGTSSAPAGTTAAGTTAAGTSMSGNSTTVGTTAPAGPVDCTAQTTCTTCATGGCMWCALGMTSETAGTLTSCVAANATCPTTTTGYKMVNECVKDNNDACEAHETCAACAGDSKCSWCDTAAAAGVGSTGSCNAGTTCKTTVMPTKLADCPSDASTIAFAALVAVLAFVAAL